MSMNTSKLPPDLRAIKLTMTSGILASFEDAQVDLGITYCVNVHFCALTLMEFSPHLFCSKLIDFGGKFPFEIQYD